jgi:methyltransferase (TIGR00027 family)
MRSRPSRTAMMVAFWRSLADRGVTSIPNFSDPFAQRLIEGRWWRRFFQRALQRGEKFRPWVDGLVLRVVFIDKVIAETRPRQVVILGAGLDTRAWRLESLRGVRLFEVDHPATQGYKRKHAPKLGAPLAELEYVAVDFVRDDLATRLYAAGFAAEVPTLFIWEGVIMYLDDRALRSTLRAIRSLSAPGSRLLAHYHEPHERQGLFRQLIFRFIGEPQIGLRTRATMLRELEGAGFSVAEDAGIDEQAARAGASFSRKPPLQVSRIAVATVS